MLNSEMTAIFLYQVRFFGKWILKKQFFSNFTTFSDTGDSEMLNELSGDKFLYFTSFQQIRSKKVS